MVSFEMVLILKRSGSLQCGTARRYVLTTDFKNSLNMALSMQAMSYLTKIRTNCSQEFQAKSAQLITAMGLHHSVPPHLKVNNCARSVNSSILIDD